MWHGFRGPSLETKESLLMGDQAAASSELTRSSLSFCMLKEVLQSTNLNDDEEAVMITRMRVDPRHVQEFEQLLRLILKAMNTVGHVSTCVVRPPPGEVTYTSIVTYSKLHAMRQIYPSTLHTGVDFDKLVAARDALLLEPPTYQIEAGFGTWIDADGQTEPMQSNPDVAQDENPVYHHVPSPCCNDSCENPHGLIVRASFVAPTHDVALFQPRYQRNNKKGGQKNLRCFPSCRHNRHVSSGFCGDAIRVHVAVSRVTASGGVKICPIPTTRPAIVAFARFVNVTGPFEATVSGPPVVPGQPIDKHDLLAYVRDKQRPRNPLYPGLLRGAAMETSLQSAMFEFNAECKAWHYGWTAPRGQGVAGHDTHHVLEVLLMKPMGSYLYCLERLRSDAFAIFSSRRASPVPDIRRPAEPCLKRKRVEPPCRDTVPIPSHAATLVPACSSGSTARASIQPDGLAPVESTSVDDWIDGPSCRMETIFTSVPSSMTLSPDLPLDQRLESVMDQEDDTPLHEAYEPPRNLHEVLRQQHQVVQHLAEHTMLDQVQEGGTLAHHVLFQEDQAVRRVVSSEELPWAELYNLFETTPQSCLGSDNDSDDEKLLTSKTSTSSMIQASTAHAKMAALSIAP